MFKPSAATLGRPVFGSLAIWGMVLAGLSLLTAAGCGGIAAQSQNAEGVRLFDQGRYQDAMRQFEQAVVSDPNNADGYYNLATICHRLGVLNNDPSQLAQAEHYYNQCLDRDENHRECYRGLAVLLVEQQQSEEAFRLLQLWADRNPTSAEPNIELARLFEEFGDLKAARERLTKAITVDPRNARALAALGRVREQAGEHALALNNYQQSLWHNQFQPGVAARIAALQPALGPPGPTLSAPPDETWVASRNTIPLR